jgi:hypothetical protein
MPYSRTPILPYSQVRVFEWKSDFPCGIEWRPLLYSLQGTCLECNFILACGHIKFCLNKKRKREAFQTAYIKCLLCTVFTFRVCLSFGSVSRPRAMALTRLPSMVSGHTRFTSLSVQLPFKEMLSTHWSQCKKRPSVQITNFKPRTCV